MKRKRGKKRMPKGPAVGAAKDSYPGVISPNTSPNTAENSDVEEFDNDEYETGMDVDTPSSVGTSQLHNVSSINPDGSLDKMAVKSVSRVKVKLKSTKFLDSQHTSSDAPTQSDTDKSSQHVGFGRPGLVTEKMEDSASSLPGTKAGNSGNSSLKAGSIRIKSSNVNQTGSTVASQAESTHAKELLINHREPQYNKQELDAALEVIKKVMKMDASEPFNAPVNPDALGIPDYFDVIDTPMDFGTICSNLESGIKYMNSEDVYKDVQYIWDNCIKYNSKGDYIMDLMKRVRKNFIKYWTAAGLYSEQLQGIDGSGSIQVDGSAPPGQSKVQLKVGYPKQKARKRHGRHHKDDCLCAICVLKRRRREREENERLARGQIGVGDNNLANDLKQEESSQVDSPYGEDSSSNMDESLDPHADDEGEVKEDMDVTEQQFHPTVGKHKQGQLENGMENQEKDECEILKETHYDERLREGANLQSHTRMLDKSGNKVHLVNQKGDIVQRGEGSASVEQQKQEDINKRIQREKMLATLSYQNPMLLGLCGVLFPDNPKSVWSGPHSLVRHRGSAPAQNSSIHAAIETFLK